MSYENSYDEWERLELDRLYPRNPQRIRYCCCEGCSNEAIYFDVENFGYCILHSEEE